MNADNHAKTILVVEDNPLNMKLAVDLLEFHGFRVVQALDGESALEILKSLRPDLILLDIGLPGIDGLEVFRRIRGNPALKNIKVAAVTASAMKEEKEKILEMGFSAFISKPIQPKGFVEEVKEMVNGKVRVASGERKIPIDKSQITNRSQFQNSND